MDGWLFYLQGRRVSRLRRTDLPILARALVAYVRRQCKLESRTFAHELSYLHFFDEKRLDVVVLASDWERIAPLVKDGLLTPELFPPNPPPGYMQPEVLKEYSLIDLNDRPFYLRVLGLLQSKFTTDYPTSNL